MTTGGHPIRAKNVHSADHKQKILLILYTSKTHGHYSRLQKIKIWSDSNQSSDEFSPFLVTTKFLRERGGYVHDDEPLFIFSDRTPVRPRHFKRVLRTALRNLGLDSRLYDMHSFRIGRASDLIRSGATVEQVKRLGRWRSNAVYKYMSHVFF